MGNYDKGYGRMKKLNRIHIALLITLAGGVFLLARHGDRNALVVFLFVAVSVWVWALVKRRQ